MSLQGSAHGHHGVVLQACCTCVAVTLPVCEYQVGRHRTLHCDAVGRPGCSIRHWSYCPAVQVLAQGNGTILHAACTAFAYSDDAVAWVLEQLLPGAAQILLPDTSGFNPLHSAASHDSSVTTLATLVQAGYNVNAPSLRYVEEQHLREGLVGGTAGRHLHLQLADKP